MQIGIASFVDTDPAAGAAGAAQRLRELVEQAELAEQVGLEVVAVGEHHRPDFAVSSPAVVLAAVAARTERVRLSSGVTVLSSDDPVRVYQDFATLDLLSRTREAPGAQPRIEEWRATTCHAPVCRDQTSVSRNTFDRLTVAKDAICE